ncbi:phospholipase [Legionella sp. MW5194]|nr:phospholipase [Legionella sp. MW5194]
MLLMLPLASGAKTNEESPPLKKPTLLEKQVMQQKKTSDSPSLIELYRPNYVLPYYYTNKPFHAIYQNATPNNQEVQNDEFKAQISLKIPIFRHVIKDKPLALNFSYTQLMYWQVYAKSQYFRETNYEPELFLENYFNPYFAAQLGLNHQSNGRGGSLERSWNRAYTQLKWTGNRWLVNLRLWALIDKAESSDLHNPDIAHFLGHDNLVLSHQLPGDWKASLELQNLESGLQRGFVQVTLSYPILQSLSVYGQVFSGYGQSLIEYNHRTTSAGIGIVLNDWVS